MIERQRPPWAVRLQTEREERGWSKAEMGRRLRQAIGADHSPLDSLTRQIRDWEAGKHYPRDWAAAYAIAFGLDRAELFPETSNKSLGQLVPDDAAVAAVSDALDFASWLEQTNVGNGAIAYLTGAVQRLASDYARQPPVTVMGEAVALQRRVTGLVRGGRQRLAHTQELLRVSSELFSLLTLLAGDVGRYQIADAYGHAAWTCAEEADSDLARALVLCAQSKTARWERQYGKAAELAHRGFEVCPPGLPKVLLGASEATALQSRGDIQGAYAALRLTQLARDELGADVPEVADAWSCPRARQATYALQVGLGAGDPAAMLREVQSADGCWADGDPWVYGTWAQVRIGAALAHAMNGEPEGAEAELSPVFELGPEYRVVTIIGRMGEVSRRLCDPRYHGDRNAAALRERIREFQAGSLEYKVLTAGDAL